MCFATTERGWQIYDGALLHFILVGAINVYLKNRVGALTETRHVEARRIEIDESAV